LHNPYNYHLAVRDDAMFFGREKVLGRLLGGLCDPIPHSAAIFGGRRCGKTSLLNKLSRMLRGDVQAAGGRRFVPCSLDLQGGRPLSRSADFFLWVLEELGETWESHHKLEHGQIAEPLQACYRAELTKGPVDAFVRAFQSLDRRGERVRVVILVDESEGILTAEWGDDLRSNLRSLLSNSAIAEDVALVMAGSTQAYTKITEHDSPLENILDRHSMPTLSREATLALARRPNDDHLPEKVAEEVWRQTGGQPCTTQYILHELWNQMAGALQNATAEDVQEIAETFEDRTHHFSAWARTLGRPGHDVYHFLVEQDAATTYLEIRQRFSKMTVFLLQSMLDALLYHGLVHCYGYGRKRKYEIAGRMYREWFLSAGEITAFEESEKPQPRPGAPTVIYDIHGPQIGNQVAITGDGNVVGDDSSSQVVKND
jgi:hypothetical protein